MLCRPFGDLSRDWLCYVDTLVILPVFVYAMYFLCIQQYMYSKALVNPGLAMLYRPFGDLSRVWLYYVGPLVTLAVFGYVM